MPHIPRTRQTSSSKIYLLLAVILVTVTFTLHSDASTDPNTDTQQVNIFSDNVVIDQPQQEITFNQKVMVVFHDVTLTTDTLIIYYSAQDQDQDQDKQEQQIPSVADHANVPSQQTINSPAKHPSPPLQPSIKTIIMPSKIKAVRNSNQEVILADQGIFDNTQKILTLTGHVKLSRGSHILVADQVVYKTKLSSITQLNHE